jgi:diguanylate cyclase (GGDEF)-like protein
MVDLDRFKHINDTYGHLDGDAVLREAARRMKAAGRCYDSIGRYGGEEFLIVLPGCNAADARAQAERVRESLAGAPFAAGSGSLDVTCSIGVSCALIADADTLIREADEALYQAKSRGRNRVALGGVYAEELPAPAMAGRGPAPVSQPGSPA